MVDNVYNVTGQVRQIIQEEIHYYRMLQKEILKRLQINNFIEIVKFNQAYITLGLKQESI